MFALHLQKDEAAAITSFVFLSSSIKRKWKVFDIICGPLYKLYANICTGPNIGCLGDRTGFQI